LSEKTVVTPGSFSGLIQRHPISSYFVLAYSISWLGASAVAAPYWLRGEAVPKMSGLMMFPVMILGPCVAGVVMTIATHGRAGLRNLRVRMSRLGSPAWLAMLFLPPALVFGVLLVLKIAVSPAFSPNRFPIGFAFGCSAGLFEEIGWMGFAFPAMRSRQSAIGAAASLGLLWSLWHIPVIDYLGSATPHGAAWLPFLLAFTAAMSAMRVLICWIYVHTESVLLAQLLHASSTGALATFSPGGVTAGQEVLWYALYAVALWLIVATVATRFGKALSRTSRTRSASDQTRAASPAP
jgi:uncharacterized protein